MDIPARRGVVTEAAMSPGSASDESHDVQVNVRTRKSCPKKRQFLRSSRRTTLYQELIPSQDWSWRWRWTPVYVWPSGAVGVSGHR